MRNSQTSQVDTGYNPPAGQNPPSTAQNRADQSASITCEYVSINKDVLQAQIALVTSVSDFLLIDHNPVEALGHVIHQWVSQGQLTTGSYNMNRLKLLLSMMDFLYDLLGNLRSLEYCEGEAEKLQQAQGGPGHD